MKDGREMRKLKTIEARHRMWGIMDEQNRDELNSKTEGKEENKKF